MSRINAKGRTGRSHATRHTRRSVVPRLEELDRRCLPAVFTVTNALDDGLGSLRDCIHQANADTSSDTIIFNIPGAGLHTISLQSPLPDIVLEGGPLVVDGYMQSDATANTDQQLRTNAVLRIEITDGSPQHSLSHAFRLTGREIIIRGLVINGFEEGTGIIIQDEHSNKIEGNFIGTDASGQVAKPNLYGVQIYSWSNIVGGVDPAARNLISGNTDTGILILGDDTDWTKVQGNIIGTKKDGEGQLGNGVGIWIALAPGKDILIGGQTTGARNLISANVTDGLFITGAAAEVEAGSENKIQGNYIGTDWSGLTLVSNNHNGVNIRGSSHNLIGGENDSARNIIVSGGLAAVQIEGTVESRSPSNVVAGNYIGTDHTGMKALGGGTACVWILNASNNTIGGLAATTGQAPGNLISGGVDSIGVRIEVFPTDRVARENVVIGNLIGTNAPGTATPNGFPVADPRGNALGIQVKGGIKNRIGGTASAERNVISGNHEGIEVFSGSENLVQGNYIGTKIDGISELKNTTYGASLGGTGNIVGGDDAGARNVIAGNGTFGVVLGGSGNKVIKNNLGLNKNGQPLKNHQDNIKYTGANGVIRENQVGWAGRYGIFADGGSNAIIEANLVYGSESDGIRISGESAVGNSILANFIGTDGTGANLGNHGDGIRVESGAGGTSVGAIDQGNIIRFNWESGVVLDDSTGNVVGVNIIDENGAYGMLVQTSTLPELINNDVWGNDISNHPLAGIAVLDSHWNRITANLIHGNDEDGILFDEGSCDNDVGLGQLAYANEIYGNAGAGVRVASGQRNAISINSIYDNGELGIDLGNDGVTANDAQDPDTGANQLQNFLVFTSVTCHETYYEFMATLNSTPLSLFTVEFYVVAAPDYEGHGEGRWFLSASSGFTNGEGNGYMAGVGDYWAFPGNYLTALVTDQYGNTSEFALCVLVQQPGG